jgi:phenylacetaldehyde dehydrogenase
MSSLTGTPYRNLIGGSWVEGGSGSYGIVNPATEETIDEAPESSVADAEAAAGAAREALPAWKRVSPEERANLLTKLATEVSARQADLLPLIMAETGATLTVGSSLQVPQAVARFHRYAKGALQDINQSLAPSIMPTTPLAAGGVIGGQVFRQPVGVVACISPYNFPLVSMAGKVGPALATGNTIVMKPAPQDPLAIHELAQICEDVGFPPGVVNLVTGSAPEVGQALVESTDVDMISFTGSTAVGARIYEAGGTTMKRLLLELGGKGACIVCEDADVGKAVAGLASVWGFHSGQICTAPTRAIVHRNVYDALIGALQGVAPTLKIGPPEAADTLVGPVISGAHRDRVEGYIQTGADEGAEVLVDGRKPDGFDKGFYVGPTLLAGCTNQMTPVREEIFGPVIVVVPYDDDDEAIAIANDSDYGLYDYVFSEDTAKAFEIAQQLECGHVGINTAQRNHEAPFGGFKMSGIGRDGGDYGLHAYTEIQSVIWPG